MGDSRFQNASASLDCETARFLHGLRQLVVHLFVRLVRRDVYAVEAGVRLGKVVRRRLDLVDGE